MTNLWGKFRRSLRDLWHRATSQHIAHSKHILPLLTYLRFLLVLNSRPHNGLERHKCHCRFHATNLDNSVGSPGHSAPGKETSQNRSLHMPASARRSFLKDQPQQRMAPNKLQMQRTMHLVFSSHVGIAINLEDKKMPLIRLCFDLGVPPSKERPWLRGARPLLPAVPQCCRLMLH